MRRQASYNVLYCIHGTVHMYIQYLNYIPLALTFREMSIDLYGRIKQDTSSAVYLEIKCKYDLLKINKANIICRINE